MAKAEATLIIPRRNFLVRALGFTAAGAALNIPIVTQADAKARIDLHFKALEQAVRDQFLGFDVQIYYNNLAPDYVKRPEDSGAKACWLVCAG